MIEGDWWIDTPWLDPELITGGRMTYSRRWAEIYRAPDHDEPIYCRGCSRRIVLHWNGGELSERECCGYTYKWEHVHPVDLVIQKAEFCPPDCECSNCRIRQRSQTTPPISWSEYLQVTNQCERRTDQQIRRTGQNGDNVDVPV